MNGRVASKIRKWAYIIAEYHAVPRHQIEKKIKAQWEGLPQNDRNFFAKEMDEKVEMMKKRIAKRLGKDELGAIK